MTKRIQRTSAQALNVPVRRKRAVTFTAAQVEEKVSEAVRLERAGTEQRRAQLETKLQAAFAAEHRREEEILRTQAEEMANDSTWGRAVRQFNSLFT